MIDEQLELDALIHDLNIYHNDMENNLKMMTEKLVIKDTEKKLSLSKEKTNEIKIYAQSVLNSILETKLRMDFFRLEEFLDDSHKLAKFKKGHGIRKVEFLGKFYQVWMAKKPRGEGSKKLKIKWDADLYSKPEVTVFSLAQLLPFILIDNAVKYSPKDGIIDVSFLEREDSIVINVENAGPFVSEEELPLLTQAYMRGNNAQVARRKDEPNALEGSGLGLYFLDKVCSESNIEYSIKCAQGEGYQHEGIKYSHFSVTLKIPKQYYL